MYRYIVTGLAFGLLLASGCGADAGSSTAESSAESTTGSAPSTSPDATPGATYFVEADTRAINEAAEPVRAALVRAQAAAPLARCDRTRSKGYPAWRACFHGLLDPLHESLQALAAQLNTLAARDFPADCVRSLSEAADTYAGFGGEVKDLLTGIDSDRRPAQARAMRTYSASLARMGEGYTKPFQALTRVCYSPEDLASIDAQPSNEPSPAPSP